MISATMTSNGERRYALLHRIVVATLLLNVSPFFKNAGPFLVHAASNDEDSASLLFPVRCRLLSEPLSADGNELRQFLERTEIRNLFLSAGGLRHSQILPTDSVTMDLWHKACTRYYGSEMFPSSFEDVDIVATETSAQFPGFRIINTVMSGCQHVKTSVDRSGGHSSLSQRILHRQSSPNPEHFMGAVHKFCLIADRKRLQGPWAVVALVGRLMGSDASTKSNVFHPSETRATTQISVISHESASIKPGREGTLYGFQIDIDCAVQVHFPKFLLRLLPGSRLQVEERGTKAVHDAVFKDATSAVGAVQDAWKRAQGETAKREVNVLSKTHSSPLPFWSRGSFGGLRSNK